MEIQDSSLVVTAVSSVIKDVQTVIPSKRDSNKFIVRNTFYEVTLYDRKGALVTDTNVVTYDRLV